MPGSIDQSVCTWLQIQGLWDRGPVGPHNFHGDWNIVARPWENVSYAICKQQRRRSACASLQSAQRLCCSLPRQNDTSSLYIQNFKILAGLCSWAGQFVSCVVGDSWRHIFSWCGSISKAILPLPLIQEGQLSVTVKVCALSTCYLLRRSKPAQEQCMLADQFNMTLIVLTGP